MAITLVQSAGASGTSNATANFSAATAGNLLVALGTTDGVASLANLTATGGWSTANGGRSTTSGQTAKLFYKVAAGGETSVTISATSASKTQCEMMEFTGLTSWALDAAPTANEPGGSVTSCATGSTGTLVSAVEVAIAGIGMTSNVSGRSWDSGFSTVSHVNGCGVAGYKIVSSTAALNPTASWTTSTNAIGLIATFRENITAVGKDLDLRWNVEGAVGKDLDLRWEVAGPVGKNLDVRWGVSGPISTFRVRTEVAWDTDPLTRPTEGVDWSELEVGVRNLNIRRGTKILSAGLESGTSSCQADNHDRSLDPSNAASPLWPNVKPRKRIRFIVEVGNSEVTLFTGFAERWPIEWSVESGWVNIAASDLFSIIASLKLPWSVLDVVTRELGASSYWPMSETVFTQTADDVIGNRDGDYVGPVQNGGQVVPFDPRPCPKFAAPLVDHPTPSMAVRSFSCPDEASFSVWLRWNPGGDADVRPPIIMLQQATDPIIPSGGFTSPNSVLVYFVDDTGDPDRQQFRILVANGSVQARLKVPVAFQILDGAPHHIVFTFDASAKDFTLFIDDLEISGFTDTGDAGTSPISGVNVSSVVAACTTLSTGWGIDYQPKAPEASAADVGHLAFWSRELAANEVTDLYEAGTVAWDGDLTGTRAERILDLIGVDAGDRDIDTGTQTCGPTILGSQNALAYLKQLTGTEQGVCFVTGDGKVRFTDRIPDTPTTVQVFSDDPATDGGVPYGPVKPDYSWDRIINTVVIGRENDADQTIVNQTSVDAYGPAQGATGGKIDTLHQTATAARTSGERIVERHGEPRVYIPSVTLDTADQGVPLEAVVNPDIGDATALYARPAGGGAPIEQDALIEALEHRFPGGNVWTVTYSLAEYPPP